MASIHCLDEQAANSFRSVTCLPMGRLTCRLIGIVGLDANEGLFT